MKIKKKNEPINSYQYDLYKQELSKIQKKPIVKDKKLNNIMNDLFRSNKNPLGNGSTATAIRHEKKTGQLIKGRNHIQQKGPDYSKALNKWLKNNSNANPNDIKSAQNVLKDLNNSLK